MLIVLDALNALIPYRLKLDNRALESHILKLFTKIWLKFGLSYRPSKTYSE